MHPAQVLVVAFNRVIANDLRKTIDAMMNEIGVEERPVVSTVHALCRSSVGGDDRLLLDHEREMMVYDCGTLDSEVAAAYPSYHRRAQALRDHEAQHANHPRLWQVSQQWLTQHTAQLVGDLPGQVLDRLRQGDFEDLRFRHVVVDEFQDLSAVEQQVLVAVRTDGGALLALGDPRQSIYAFRGNHRDGLRALEALTGQEVHDIVLTECQRCPAAIVHAANALTMLDEAEAMVPVSTVEARVRIVHWKSLQREAEGMARVIADAYALRGGDKHLVMVTRRRFGYDLRAALLALDDGFPVHLDFSESVLEEWPAREAFLWFSLLADPDPATWRSWLGHASPTDVGGTFKPPQRNSQSYLAWVAALGRMPAEADVLEVAGGTAASLSGNGRTVLWGRAVRYRDLLARRDWAGLSPGHLIDACFDPAEWGVETDSPDGLDLSMLRARAVEALGNLVDADDPERRSAVLKEVAQDLRYAIATREPLVTQGEEGVHVTTLWGAKGLTADHVYVLGLCDEAVPGQRSPEYPGDNLAYSEEQRRLLYVSLTRSKESLVISRATSADSREVKSLNLSAAARYGRWRWALTPSRFLRAISQYVPTSVAGEKWEGLFTDDPI